MVCSQEKKLYAIRDVSEMTGVKPVTLRAWQRRYNLVQPQRTEKGHRLYRQEDIDTISEIQSWLLKGVAIGKVKELLGSVPRSDETFDSYQLEETGKILDALSELNRGKVESTLAQVMKEYPLGIVIDKLINPTFEALERVKSSLRSLQIGLLQSCLMTRLLLIIDAENKAASLGKCLLVSFEKTRPIESWLQAAILCEQGYHVTLIEHVDDVSGLVGQRALEQYRNIFFFSNQALPQKQVESIKTLRSQYPQQVNVSQVIEKVNYL
ncbi:helix-turn-helix-type transcriptional regulator [Vibrio azureus]|uniref:Putative MerR family transcriptional repressor n=1 Tax=Vibrio azureus NBRC 104587 TaxID=1219077 RepID=U3BZL1_9VIBR|nr:MerR family transcriptional regulator [Vibrio azureus]AUI87777.1 helix-turn-helix-type transcriptional regulator [Vibrio azureus]GAD74729.1 putative MerR family transcriptional repressor [Vibrio azureus NBRC 104587]